jgi:hypothetical protein
VTYQPRNTNADLVARIALDEQDSLADDQRASLDAKTVAKRLTSSIEGRITTAATIQREAGGRRMSNTEFKTFKDTVRAAGEEANLLRTIREIQVERNEASRAVVRSEPRTYSEGSDASYYWDRAIAATPGYPGHADAVARLQRHAKETAVEIRDGSPEGRAALRAAGTNARLHSTGDETRNRDNLVEVTRAMTTGSSSFLVAPAYLDGPAEYAPHFAYPPSVIKAAQPIDDPGHGMSFYLPLLATESGTPVAAQTENTGMVEADYSASYLSQSLVTEAGQVVISQQLYDRTQGQRVSFDRVVHTQLTRDLWAALDASSIASVITQGTAFAGASSFTVQKLWGDLSDASSLLETTSGTVLPPTHVFLPPTQYRFFTAQTDSSGRPILVPNPLPLLDEGGILPTGYTGERILDIPVYEDGNIPNSGSNAQLLVVNAGELFSLVTAPSFEVWPEPYAANLSVLCRLYALTATIVRHAAAVQVITGAGYPVAPSWIT